MYSVKAEISLNNAVSIRALRLVETLDLTPNRQRDLAWFGLTWRLVHQALTFDFVASKFLLSPNTFLVNVSFLSAQALQIMAAQVFRNLKNRR